MPIRPLLEADRGAFGPEELEALVAAFEHCLEALRLVNRTDPAVLLVAERIIVLAKEGERDPMVLRDRVVSSFGGGP